MSISSQIERMLEEFRDLRAVIRLRNGAIKYIDQLGETQEQQTRLLFEDTQLVNAKLRMMECDHRLNPWVVTTTKGVAVSLDGELATVMTRAMAQATAASRGMLAMNLSDYEMFVARLRREKARK